MARWGYPWPDYVPVAKRRQNAARAVTSLTKKGYVPSPVVLEGRAIATSFWGKAWCEHLERFSDFDNRLPRGRSYLRSGSVVDLRVSPGRVDARVRGTSLYEVEIEVERLGAGPWREIVRACAGKVDSLVELLQGRFDRAVMQVVGRAEGGLFPPASQISMSCSCPDWATMCKHVAAVLYGVGARLDRRPELLFTLREVDPTELVAGAPEALASARGGASPRLDAGALEAVFGIELDAGAPAGPAKAAAPAKASVPAKAAVPASPPAKVPTKASAKAKAPRTTTTSTKARRTATTSAKARRTATTSPKARRTATTSANAPRTATASAKVARGAGLSAPDAATLARTFANELSRAAAGVLLSLRRGEGAAAKAGRKPGRRPRGEVEKEASAMAIAALKAAAVATSKAPATSKAAATSSPKAKAASKAASPAKAKAASKAKRGARRPGRA
ncbi:MAG TPA: hypothetical protein VFS43_39055 [Polyangiaceae bacterium]|nr:hypothetical protein [Polyangiaceae bacterium]